MMKNTMKKTAIALALATASAAALAGTGTGTGTTTVNGIPITITEQNPLSVTIDLKPGSTVTAGQNINISSSFWSQNLAADPETSATYGCLQLAGSANATATLSLDAVNLNAAAPTGGSITHNGIKFYTSTTACPTAATAGTGSLLNVGQTMPVTLDANGSLFVGWVPKFSSLTYQKGTYQATINITVQ